MKLTCNIDQRGRRTRLVTGVIVDLCGLAGILVSLSRSSTGILVAGIFLSITGSFMIFEGARGWCALRAVGIKTPL
jgi:hypothetical protein